MPVRVRRCALTGKLRKRITGQRVRKPRDGIASSSTVLGL